ncbi:MAG: N-acetyltransferase [Alphaproteobacteria bacterium]|nr:MAG: N-acetyltransferase [Alphaproteobacteria bacterium]
MTARTQSLQNPAQSPLIRPIAADDADQLRKLYALSLKNNREGFVQCPDFHGDIYDRAKKYQAENGTMLGLFTSDGTLIGFGGLKDKGQERAELCNLHLHPDYHGHGLGKRLAMTLMDDAEHLGYGIVELHVTVTQKSAIGLYKNLGFRETNRKVYEVEGGKYDTLFMEIAL